MFGLLLVRARFDIGVEEKMRPGFLFLVFDVVLRRKKFAVRMEKLLYLGNSCCSREYKAILFE